MSSLVYQHRFRRRSVLLGIAFAARVAATGRETCTTLEDAPAVADALLQKSQLRDTPPLQLDEKDALHTWSLSCLTALSKPVLSEGVKHAPLEGKQRSALTARSSKRTIGGGSAPLNANGFKDTTSLCCPAETEIFFNRLLATRGYYVCSKPHVQGLMHWFTCVPDLDFQYVLEVIKNGNPCKYWAPTDQICPALSAECEGHHCSADSPASTSQPTLASSASTQAPMSATPAPTPARARVLAPTPAPTTAPTPAPTRAPPRCSLSRKSTVDLSAANLTQNNLAGKGPDSGTHEMHIIGTPSPFSSNRGEPFEIVITTVGPYEPAKNAGRGVQENRLYNGFGSIKVDGASESFDGKSTFRFSFIRPGTRTPVTLDEIHLAVYDLDGGLGRLRDGAEFISIFGFSGYVTHPDPSIVTSSSADGIMEFKGGTNIATIPNSTEFSGSTDEQRKGAIMFFYSDVSSIDLEFGQFGSDQVSPNFRGLLFAFASPFDDSCAP